MTGFINWNELRKTMISEGRRKRGENPAEEWDKRAEEFNRSTKDDNRTEKQVNRFRLDPNYSVLDVGAGTGRFSVPIAKRVQHVTAIDPSSGMLNYLKANMAEKGFSNYRCIQKKWGDIEIGVDIEPHDIVIASHSLGMFDLQDAMAKMDATAKKYVFILAAAGKWFYDDFEEELEKKVYKRLLGRSVWRSDYMLIYNILHDMGIYANVEIMNSDDVQRYESLDEAVERWRVMTAISDESEPFLREHLAKNITEDGNGLLFRWRTMGAMIWWPKSGLYE